MLLVNQKPITENADKVENDPMHRYAREYKQGVKFLRETYGDSIKFIRPGYPRKVRGIDPKGRDVPNMAEPTSPMMMPLTARVDGDNGMEIWSYSDGPPKILPNQMWEAGGKRSKMVTEQIVVNLRKEPELAFFLYYKSPVFKSGMLQVDDPAAAAKLRGDKVRADLDLQLAIYSVLGDETRLRNMAQAYGIAKANEKHPDILREKLREIVLLGDVKKRSDPLAKGVKEFLEDVNGNDSVRLRSLVMVMIDNGKITYSQNGKYRVGDREICSIPPTEAARKQDFLCNHLASISNKAKLKDLVKDVVDEDYLNSITDEKTFKWLAKVAELPYNLRGADDIEAMVYAEFVPEYDTEEAVEPVETDNIEVEVIEPPAKELIPPKAPIKKVVKRKPRAKRTVKK